MFETMIRITGSDYNASERLLLYDKTTGKYIAKWNHNKHPEIVVKGKGIYPAEGREYKTVIERSSLEKLQLALKSQDMEFYGNVEDKDNISSLTGLFFHLVLHYHEGDFIFIQGKNRNCSEFLSI